MPEEVTGTAPETAPVEVIAAAAQPEPQQESPEVQVERFTVEATFAPPSANDGLSNHRRGLVHRRKVPRFELAQRRGIRPHPRHERVPSGSPEQRWSSFGLAQRLRGESQLGVVRKAWAKKSIAWPRFSSASAMQ